MSDDEINKEIASIIGWTDVRIGSSDLGTNCLHGTPPSVTHAKGSWLVPNYCGDLNEMRDAEEYLIYIGRYDSNEDGNGGDAYVDRLIQIVGHWSLAFHASARQRAEAFLRTMCRWKECYEV